MTGYMMSLNNVHDSSSPAVMPTWRKEGREGGKEGRGEGRKGGRDGRRKDGRTER